MKSLIGKTLLKTPCRPTSSRFSSGDVRLQELLVALLLDVDEVRDVDDLRDLREALPRPEVVLNHETPFVTPLLAPTARTTATARARRRSSSPEPLRRPRCEPANCRLRDDRRASAVDWTPDLLLDLDLGAGLVELLLDRLGVGLGDALLDGLGRAVDQVLGLLEAEVGDLADGLDDVDLVAAGVLEDDRELGLLGGRSRRSRRRRPPRPPPPPPEPP